MERKKKLKIIQLVLLTVGISVIFYTYINKNNSSVEKIIPKETQEKIKKQLAKESQEGDLFYNIEYSGLDLAGNRYILKSKEAINNKKNRELVNMKSVNAIFYFKDGTVLNVWSNFGVYNNKTLDMNFSENVRATHEGSQLFAERASYSNSESFLTISENVIVKDFRGTVHADELFFDIKKQKLDIASFKDGKINANVNLK